MPIATTRSIKRIIVCLAALTATVTWPVHSLGITVAGGPAQQYMFEEGLKHFSAGRIDQADQVWKKIFRDAFYGQAAYVLLADAYRLNGDPARSETLLKELLEERPNTVYSEQAKRILAEVLCRQHKAEAVPLLTAMAEKARDNAVPRLLYLLAKLHRQTGNYGDAVVHYRKLFLTYPATVEGLAASEDLAWMVVHGKIPRPTFTEDEQLARARSLFARGRFDLAADSYKYLLKRNPGNMSFLLRLAECRYKGRENQEALRILKGILQGNLSVKERTEALYLMSRLYWRLDKNKEFEQCCRMLIDLGDPPMKEKALFNLGANAYERGMFEESLAHFSRVLKMTGKRSVKTDVHWKTGWIKFRTGKYEDAAEAFLRARTEFPGGRITNASLYWQARSLMHLDRGNEAKDLLKQIVRSSPLDYYGQESAELLRAMGDDVKRRRPGGLSFPNVKLTAAELANPRVSDAGKLMECGLHELALANLDALPESMKSSPAVVFLTAKAAYGAQQYRKARDILSRAFSAPMANPPEDAPAEFIDMAFPRVHQEATAKAAKRHSVDPDLVWAVIRQESLYDASAVSPAGALGLMQVTPKAAGVIGRHGRIPAGAIARLLDPEENVAYGVRILSDNLRSFRGQIVPAVASYNADITKVRGWVKKNGKMSQDVFIENIPYLETRRYVKEVLAGYRAYAELHRKKDLAGLW
ncbi:MAG: transglycosylase SLT domain-containing protein [Pseudomonadota bacterium]